MKVGTAVGYVYGVHLSRFRLYPACPQTLCLLQGQRGISLSFAAIVVAILLSLCAASALAAQARPSLGRALLQDEYDAVYDDDTYFYGEPEDFDPMDEFGDDWDEYGLNEAVQSAVMTLNTPSPPQPPQGAKKPAASTPTAAAPSASKSTRNKKPTLASKVVSLAPEANVTYGDDIDDEGSCKKEIAKYCEDIEEGDGQLADCISDHITMSEEEEDDDKPNISDACREEVYQYKIQRNSNINRNIPLARACKVDADKFCNVTWFFGWKQGQIISCLKDVQKQLSKPCKVQVFKVMLDAAMDVRSDPQLWAACKEDADQVCQGIKPGGGRIQACLRDKRQQLSWSCEEELFRQELESADDIRLSVRLFSKCIPDKRKFCKDIEPGHARTKDCLEEHRDELSGSCREEIDQMIENRVRDFRLDSKLRDACESEISSICNYFRDVDDIDTYDSTIINCLQDFRQEIKNTECSQQVKKYVILASQDIRFDVSLAEACYDDRQRFCSTVQPGSARVIRCLTNQRDKLSPVCRATLFDEEVRFSENIDFQYPMKEACRSELTKFCKDVPHGNARAIRCLQDNKNKKEFGKACKEELMAYEAEISKDYRLNYRLKKNCESDVKKICPNVCSTADGSVCGGKVLRCLTDNIESINAEACRKEVYYYEKMEVENYKNDIILAEACRADVEKLCANVEAGEGRVHKCLRDNRKKLSEKCRAEELLLEEKEASSIELAGGLLRSCKAERQLYCSAVQAGSARVFRCLAENMNDADFSNTCKYQIIYKLQRRQANWKLDPPLRKACRTDVQKLCSAEEAKQSEEGLVYKCLIAKASSLQAGCQKELGRAVHMAFYVWQPGAIMTSDCDDDIKNICLAARPNMSQRPGAVGSCLASILERQDGAGDRRILAKDDGGNAKDKSSQAAAATEAGFDIGPVNNPKALSGATLSPACSILADIAEPPNLKQAFDSSLSFALLKSQLDKIETATGIPLVARSQRGVAQGISLTGWVALMGVAALVILVAFGAYTGYKRMRGISDSDYTLVVKQQHK